MRLTSRTLELFSRPGRGAAANEISKAATKAAAAAIRTIGRVFDRDAAAKEICVQVSTLVRPVLSKHAAQYGACDSEPRRAVYSFVCRKVAKHYRLSQWEDDELWYATY